MNMQVFYNLYKIWVWATFIVTTFLTASTLSMVLSFNSHDLADPYLPNNEHLALKKQAIKEEQQSIHLLFGGDLMFDRGVKRKVKQDFQGEYRALFYNLQPLINSVDFLHANLEGPLSNKGKDTGKPYSFRFDPTIAQVLNDVGVSNVSLANNHMLDWGHEALCDTVTWLKRSSIGFSGAGCDEQQAQKPYRTVINNTAISVFAYTEFYQGAHAVGSYPGLSYYEKSHILNSIKNEKENTTNTKDKERGVVIVSMHWGQEYEPQSSSAQQELAHDMIDAGADVIVGHHPHVTQEIEWYKGKPINLFSR